MKHSILLIISALLLVSVASCKKDNNTKPAATTATNPALSSTAALTGKWYIVKDSVVTLDLVTVIPNLVAGNSFTTNDFITFGKDSTAVISNTHAFAAFYTDYEASNTDSKLSVNTNIVPNLSFKYHVGFEGYAIQSATASNIAQPVFALSAQNLAALTSVGYNITMPDANRMILEHDLEIPTLQHDYRIKEYVYLSK